MKIDSSAIFLPTGDNKLIDFNSGGRTQLAQILNFLPQLVYLKDARTRQYIWCNKKFANFLGVNGPEQVAGKLAKDFIGNVEIYDLNNLELAKHIEEQAIATKKIFYIEKQLDLKQVGVTNITGTIIPILDNNEEVDSLLCFGSPFMLISDKPLTDAFKALNRINISKLVYKPKYPLQTKYGVVKISRRETQYILYMLKGLTTKEIAVYMDVSVKTVEKYIESIKSKTGCNSRSDLISTIIEGGLLENL